MIRNRTKAAAFLGVALLALVVVAAGSESLSGGINRTTTPQKLPPEGCICHGPNGATDGVPNANVEVLFRIEPREMVYKPGGAYNLTVGAAATDVPPEEGSNQGGFNLKVTVGELAAAEGWEEFIQVTAGTEATHTAQGDQNGRTFNLTWKAPTAPEAPAVFTLFVNTVNGNGQQDDGDHWNGGTFVMLHEAGAVLGAGTGFENPEHIGVNWLAHWVGIVSFVAVIVTLLIYYFVLKYGESIHTTDHRDRKEK